MMTRSQTRSNTGKYIKYVLEQPPILFTIVNILYTNHCKKEAGALKLVLKSIVTNDVIDKVFQQTIYAFNLNNPIKERIMRYKFEERRGSTKPRLCTINFNMFYTIRICR
jgi:hypothetical protein